MWFTRKKKKETPPIASTYHVGDEVGILQKDFSSLPGVIYDVSLGPEGEVLYAVQVGGECPYVKGGLKESQIKKL